MKQPLTSWVVVAVFVFPATAAAYFVDEDGTFQILGRAYTQSAMRTEATSGFTFPDTPAGHIVQQRNLLEVEVAHRLDGWLQSMPAWMNDVSYRLLYKGVYEGVWDYGPREYSEQVEVNPPNPFDPDEPVSERTVHRGRINRQILGHQDEIWNAYSQGSAGPLFLRIGRQNLSWGETDGFRLLDMINPLDNRFGLPLVEDLDDRRIPLWMARGTLALPWQTTNLTNLTLDSYFAPAQIAYQESPVAPRGSPFAVPAPPSFLEREVTTPGRAPNDSRGGGRLLATLFDKATVSVAHYVTWNDNPSSRIRVAGVDLSSGRPVPEIALDLVFYQQQITGGTFTTYLDPPVDLVLRSEIALFWDERIFDPTRAGGGAAFQPLVASAIADRLAGGTGQAAGGFTPRDVLRWVLGLDKVFWIRFLNPTNTFTLSTQVFHTHIFDYENTFRNGVVNPGTNDFVPRKEDEFTVTWLMSTLLWRGRLQPGAFMAYDPRGVISAVPAVTWLIGTHFRLTLKYEVTCGNFVNLGFFRDRDELLLRAEVSL